MANRKQEILGEKLVALTSEATSANYWSLLLSIACLKPKVSRAIVVEARNENGVLQTGFKVAPIFARHLTRVCNDDEISNEYYCDDFKKKVHAMYDKLCNRNFQDIPCNPEIDGPVLIDEVRSIIKKLKLNKSCSLSLINNEMLLC